MSERKFSTLTYVIQKVRCTIMKYNNIITAFFCAMNLADKTIQWRITGL